MEVTGNEFGTNSSNYPDRFTAWRFAAVATQQKLGLWTDRWFGAPADNRFDPAPLREDLAG